MGLQVWRGWDKKYERLARRAGRIPGTDITRGQPKRSSVLQVDLERNHARRPLAVATPSGPLCTLGVEECCESRTPVCPATIWELAAKPVCTPIIGKGSERRTA